MNRKELFNILFKKSNLVKNKEYKINSRINYLDDNNVVFIISEETNLISNDDYYLVKYEVDKFLRMVGMNLTDVNFIVFDKKSASIINNFFPNNKIIYIYDKNLQADELNEIRKTLKNVVFKYVNDVKFFKLPPYVILVDLNKHYLKRNFDTYTDDIIILELNTDKEIESKNISFQKVKVDKPGWVYDPTSGLWIHSYGWDGIEIIKGY